MQLIGMLDSPYVRRVAISLRQLDLAYEHKKLSVFRDFDELAKINPAVKVPTLVCDDGTVLLDSSLILQYLERQASPGRSLMPDDPADYRHALHVIGLSLAACEKCVQLLYERQQRPAEKRHEPWMARVKTQIGGAFSGLERIVADRPLAATAKDINQAGITVAVTWRFATHAVADAIETASLPALTAHSAAAEKLPAFRETAFN